MQQPPSITTEQREQLKKFVSEEEIKNFINKLDNNYGDGEVLNFQHILNIFEKQFYKIQNEDYLTIYIDTLRMLKLFERSEAEISILIKWDEVRKLHDLLVSSYGQEINDKISAEYEKAVSSFKGLTQKIDGVNFELISTLKELNYEGSKMNHCIATYVYIIASGKYIGLRVFNKNNNERLTLGCFREGNKLVFNQLKGWGNIPASKKSCASTVEFCKANGIAINVENDYDLFPLRKEVVS